MGKLGILLVYPGSPETGASTLGFQRVLSLFREGGNIFCRPLFTRGGVEEDPERFRVIAFSIPYEPLYLDVVHFLRWSGIEPSRKGRRERGGQILIAGGIAPSLNPLPLSEIFDLLFIGDGERAFPFLNRAMERYLTGSVPDRDSFLSSLHGEEGFFIPDALEAGDRVRRAFFRGLEGLEPSSTLNSMEGGGLFHGAPLIEVGRGCGQGCRFCATGFFSRPPAFFSAGSIMEILDRVHPGNRRVGLVGSDILGHPGLKEIGAGLRERGIGLTLSSVNISRLRALEHLHGTGLRSITLAPESVPSGPLEFINKVYDRDQLLIGVEEIGRSGILNMKLYFLVGIPGEGDIALELGDFILKIREAFIKGSKGRGRVGRVSVRVNPLIPKPWTPFQWFPMIRKEEMEEKRTKILAILKGVPNLRVSFMSWREALLECYLGRGEREAGENLIREDWQASHSLFLRGVGKGARSLAESEIPFDSELPWDIVDPGVKKDDLLKELERSARSLTTPACDTSSCSGCGIGCAGKVPA